MTTNRESDGGPVSAAAPGQASADPVQAAFDAFWASPALGSEPSAPLDRESPGIQAAWKAAVDAAIAAREPDAADGDLRTALQSLAAFWVREYVTADGWPDVCAKQLLDVLGGAREPQPAPELAADPELREAMAETRKVQDILAGILRNATKGGAGWNIRIGQVATARAWAATREPVPEELREFL